MATDTPEARYQTWLDAQRAIGAPAMPAATVVILRDQPAGLEVLLLRRNTAVEFAGGFWVFPGGRIDDEDHDPARPGIIEASRRAAVRESAEEAAQVVDPDSMRFFAHWTPPPTAPKRFATFFYACRAVGHAVDIDGSEIHDYVWVPPAEALARHVRREIDLAPPTWVSLHYLTRATTVDDALDLLGARPPRFYETHIVRVPDGPLVAVWAEDAAYESGDLDAPGPRHRLAMVPGGWVFDDSAVPF
jgi:8-oxo-dGTP pyrophosphatase MutT (NUDIX family)